MSLRTLALAFAFGLTACATAPPSALPKASTPLATSPPPRAIEIRVDARFGDAEARCGVDYQTVGATKATVTLQDLRLYVSNVRLLTPTGSEVPLALTPDGMFQSNRVALLDFENATGACNGSTATNTTIRGVAPAGNYVGLAFEIGVPVDLNHQDPTLAAAPLNFSALAWAWRFGYKFTTIDLETKPVAGAPSSAKAASGFSIHLGSVDCGAGSPRTPPEVACSAPNRAPVRLERFDPATQAVIFDLSALLEKTDVTINSPGTASGCMSSTNDDDCTAIMERFGLPFRDATAKDQRFVRVGAVEAK